MTPTTQGENMSDPTPRARNLNALKHGLFAKEDLLPGEDINAYGDFVNLFLADLLPQGAYQLALAARIAGLHWRLGRIPALETRILKSRINEGEIAKRLSLLSLYEGRISREADRLMKQLAAAKASARREGFPLSDPAQLNREAYPRPNRGAEKTKKPNRNPRFEKEGPSIHRPAVGTQGHGIKAEKTKDPFGVGASLPVPPVGPSNGKNGKAKKPNGEADRIQEAMERSARLLGF